MNEEQAKQARDAEMYRMMIRTRMIAETETDEEVRVHILQNAGASGGRFKSFLPVADVSQNKMAAPLQCDPRQPLINCCQLRQIVGNGRMARNGEESESTIN